jgi:hypothetical protein
MSQQQPSASEVAALVRALVARTPSRIAGATVAIVGSLSRNVRHLGTGTLLAVADAKFVVTAAHVLKMAKEQDLTVAISPALGGVFTAVTARPWALTSDSGASEHHDVALYRLDERELGRLGAVEFVRIADVCFERDLAAAYFVVCGFPGMWSTASNPDGHMKSRLLQYGTYPFKGTTSGLGGFDPERHILLEGTPGDLLDHNGEPTRFQTRSGHPASMPGDLSGISGCSVWRIGDFRTPVSEWNINGAQIVGVQTGVFKSAGAIKATRWNSVTTLLHSACPDLRATINMYASM